MAELKFEEYTYQVDESSEQMIQQAESFYTPERPEVVVVPLSPARRLKRISKLEKAIAVGLIFATLAISLFMIHLRTSITQIEHNISIIQSDVSTEKEKKLQLEQEKSELSKSERIRKIAEEKGLTIHSDNLRKVK
ncbi:cell division protein FtsL [Enterococcus lemanii]|uniref:Cell division protein FtsL n=1 Tax=Enterococcus lemanii TaxID=1159752 RepID=A0ABV9MZI6_9ENTE|nr:cell division protein FtsL [Enterococcus lemanii]MBM7708157.1 cell division protein FtsL [Enterococcus lemanii]